MTKPRGEAIEGGLVPGTASDAFDPVIEAYKQGIDRTLLLENLKKTPHERVLALIALQRLAREAREAGERLRGR